MSFLSKILAMAGGAIAGPVGYKLVDMAVDYLDDDRHGGITGLINSFRTSGLGDMVSSWISTGPNLAITPAQIESVVGGTKLQQMAQTLGISTTDVANGLASVLPQIIDKLTPDGKLPENPSAALKTLAERTT
jgi:uncharacterized protein YidB (DUF937 family)